MNTATQLLERLEFLCIGSEDPDLHKDIKAYLAKQQAVDIEPRTLQGIHEAGIKAKQQVEQAKNPYEQAIDDELVNSFLGTKDDFKDAKTALLALIDWHCAVALDPSVSAQISKQVEQEPIGTVRQSNGCTYIEWNHVPPEAGTICYAAPQAREPMSDDEKRYQYLRNRPLDAITRGGVFAGMTPENIVLNGVDLDDYIDAAIEAHHGIRVKIGVTK